jgi:aminoglycoside 3-N-acetyltransferase
MLPQPAQRRLRTWRKRVRGAWARRFHAFGPDDLGSALARLGVRHGDCLLVHSSLERFEGFTGTPSDVLEALQTAVGTEGTLLMPTLPFTGMAVDYASRQPLFDVERTPSKMGLLTELFRRSPGVLRSTHPTHSVAARGPAAAELLAAHHQARTPCGRGSPFARLHDRNGRILFLGAAFGSMTFFHYVEEVMESGSLPSPFTREEFLLRTRDRGGAVLECRTRLFDPARSRRRNLRPLSLALRERGAWREGVVGGVPLILVEARAVLEAARDLTARGQSCYER